MCGIAGIVNFGSQKPPALNELRRMAAALTHRGPDDEGFHLDETSGICGLAHRRLSVIDPAGGHQPLSNPAGTLWISYNGECYNFQELRGQLEAKGHAFQTSCDTEVVLRLYEVYGERCVEHMRGMFALAIWDQSQQRLFLARDRLGQKPLYYALHKGRFIFASECKAILQTEGFPRQVNDAALGPYLLLQYVPCPLTAFKNIRQLEPAHTLTVDARNFDHPVSKRYWSMLTETGFNGCFTQAVEQVRTELAEATRLRMISDVPLGAFLSGGIDSTIITGLMSGAGDQAVTTCSIGFEEKMYNELPLARQVSERYQSRHHEFIVSADGAATVEQLAQVYDDPFADCSALPTWHLCRLAREQVTVALTGDGGDELFGGYDRYRALKLAQRMQRHGWLRWLANRRFWQRSSGGEQRSRLRNLKRFMAGVNLPVDRQYLYWLSVFSSERLNELLVSEVIQNHSPDMYQNYLANDFGSDSNGNTRIHKAMECDLHRYLPGDLNVKTDRASMAFGLELRSPFQDHRVAELAMSLPVSWKIKGGVGKYILRQACGNLIPASINRQPKRGFGVPVGQWFRGPLREMFCDTVLAQRAAQRGYFHRAAIETLLQENDRSVEDHGHRMWALLMLELWHRNYIDSSS